MPLLVLLHECGVPLVAVPHVPEFFSMVPVALDVVLLPRALRAKLLQQFYGARHCRHQGVARHQLRDRPPVERVVHVLPSPFGQRVPQSHHRRGGHGVLGETLGEVDKQLALRAYHNLPFAHGFGQLPAHVRTQRGPVASAPDRLAPLAVQLQQRIAELLHLDVPELGGVGFLEIDVPHVVLTSFAVRPVIKLVGFLFGLPFPDLLFVPELLRRFYAHAAVE